MKMTTLAPAEPDFMCSAVKGICENLRTNGSMNWETALLTLERVIPIHAQRYVRFTERPVICGCYCPQVEPYAEDDHDFLKLRYHVPDGNVGENPHTFFRCQISLLTVLATASKEFLYSLDPDQGMDYLLYDNPESKHLVQEVMKVLEETVIL